MILDVSPDRYDFTTVHAILCWIGASMAIWCHQLWGRGVVTTDDFKTVRGMHRISCLLLSLSFMWSISYAYSMNWRPWPSYVLTVFAVDLYLLATLLASTLRGKVFG